MPTYAILGGTGNTGTELIRLLANKPDVVLHVYARSRDRLVAAHPVLTERNTRHRIFAGALDDVDLFERCLAGADVVYGVVGTNANKPGLHLAADLATVIIAALSRLRESTPSYVPPPVVFTTSAGMASDPRVHANIPGPLHWLAQRVGKYIYEDFRVATALFRRPTNAWIPVILFCAPGLMPGPTMGDIKVGVDIAKTDPAYVTYTDLARGMIRGADEVATWAHKEIGMAGARMPPMDYGMMMFYFATGLLCVWAPPLWRFGNRRDWWGNK